MAEMEDIKFNSSLDRLQSLSKKAIDHGQQLGLTQVEVTLSNGFKRSIEIKGNSITGVQQQAKTKFLVRGYIGKQLGMASSTSLSSNSVDETVNDAYKLAKLAPEDDNFQSLPEPGLREPQMVKNIFDERLANYDPADIIERVNDMIQGAQEVHEKANVSGKLDLNTTEKVVANSLGINTPIQDTSLMAYSSISIPIEPTNVGTGFEFFVTRSLDEQPEFYEIGKEGGKQAKSMLGARPMDSSKKLPVLFDERATATTLGSITALGASGYFIMTGVSYFADKIGDEIGVDNLNIWDDPHVENGRGSSVYDDEGVPTMKLDLIEDGILKSYTTGSYTSKQLGLENTGHARKFGKSTRPFCHQVQIGAGDDSFDAILEDMKEGILIKQRGVRMQGLSPEISAKIDQGYFVEDGEIQYPLKDTMLGSNVFDFLKSIRSISKDLRIEFGSQSPAMLVEEIDITGADEDQNDGGPRTSMSTF